MSYLDVPRLHFSGQFVSDPGTANNRLGSCCSQASPLPPSECSYNNAVAIDGNPTLEGWNKSGAYRFQLRGCRVSHGLDASGSEAPASDSAIGGVVESTDDPRPARVVDLDPEHQTSSQIWGLGIHVTDSSGGGLTGRMDTSTLRELWMSRAPTGFARGIGGVYQSVLTGVTWTPQAGPMQSGLLDALRTASGSGLSIKMVLYAYDHRSASPDFTVGQVVGTIGPARSGEPPTYIAERRVVHAGAAGFAAARASGAVFNAAPFKVDVARRRLVIDLGNALPESAPAGPRQTSIGLLQAQIVHAHPTPAETVGTIAYDVAHYRRTAGIEEVPLTATQVTALGMRPLRVRGDAAVVLAEHPTGINVDVDQTVVRLNPGETCDVTLTVTQFGAPKAGASVIIAPSRPGGTLVAVSVRAGPGFGTVLPSFPAIVTADAGGRAPLRLVAGDPGHPRPHVDGQVSHLGFFLASATTANLRGEINIRVFDRHPMPASPSWADVQSILLQYFRLYPSMRFLDLSDHATVTASRGIIAAALQRPETDPGHMPVSRDLSRDKKALVLAWLSAGAP